MYNKQFGNFKLCNDDILLCQFTKNILEKALYHMHFGSILFLLTQSLHTVYISAFQELWNFTCKDSSPPTQVMPFLKRESLKSHLQEEFRFLNCYFSIHNELELRTTAICLKLFFLSTAIAVKKVTWPRLTSMTISVKTPVT